MAKRKKVSKTTQEYNKELARIKRFINRAQKRGFIFPENVIPNRPKKITSKSVSRLKKLNPDTLYRKATYVDTTTGELRRGEVGREIERSKTAKKAAETRRAKKGAERNFWTGASPKTPKPSDPINFGTPEDLDRIRLANFLDELFARLGTPITSEYQTEFGQTRRRAAAIAQAAEQARQVILKAVDRQIVQYGKAEFGRMLQEQAADISMYIDMLLYASTSSAVNTAYTGLYQIIIGTNPSDAEKRIINDLEEYEDDWAVY